jgi:hypothetical protein
LIQKSQVSVVVKYLNLFVFKKVFGLNLLNFEFKTNLLKKCIAKRISIFHVQPNSFRPNNLAAQFDFHFPFLLFFLNLALQHTGPLSFWPVTGPLPYRLPPSVIAAVPSPACTAAVGRSTSRHPIWFTPPRPLLSWNRRPMLFPSLRCGFKA